MVALDELGARWGALINEIVTGMRDWRTAHPTATFQEIEVALDERWHRVRARMLEEAALASRVANLAGQAAAERPACPDCGQALEARGQHERTVTVQGNQQVRLVRSYGVCPVCGTGLFPPG